MEMLKYPSIENHYRDKEIAYWLNMYPELADEEFVLQEKIHGANIQLIFTPEIDLSYSVASRNRILGEDENFYDVRGLLIKPVYNNMLSKFKGYAQNIEKTIRVYGEIYGKGVQKGIDYNVDREIKFFDVSVDGKFLPYFEVANLFIDLGLHPDAWMVPIVVYAKGLLVAINIDVENPTRINWVEGNICEGVVIKPRNKVYTSDQGSVFMLKKKNDKFLEKAKEKKVDKRDPSVIFLGVEFAKYINDNRVQSYFSKEGEIEKPNQMGQYILAIIEDAKEDFLKDNEAVKLLSDKNQKEVFKTGAKVTADILKKYL